MLRKLIAVVAIVALTIMAFGCRKKPAAETPQKMEVKNQAEYNEMAKKEITPENMQAELDKIEKQMQQEKSQGF
jgi:nitrous oxide reductase accessory protein NosL